MQQDSTINSLSNALSSLTIKDNTPPPKIGYCFDERMLLHKDFQNKHQECPERAMTVYMNIVDKGIANQLHRVFPDEPKESDILSVHTKEYFESMHHSIFPPLSDVVEINFTKNQLSSLQPMLILLFLLKELQFGVHLLFELYHHSSILQVALHMLKYELKFLLKD